MRKSNIMGRLNRVEAVTHSIKPRPLLPTPPELAERLRLLWEEQGLGAALSESLEAGRRWCIANGYRARVAELLHMAIERERVAAR